MKPQQTGIVNIRGREYQTVALRVQNFREGHSGWTLQTMIVHRDEACVVMRCEISDEAGRLIATGHAEEYRKASEINKTSALENCETSAIGRALAALGMGGSEFASADEVARAVSGAKGTAADMRITATNGAMSELSDRQKAYVARIAAAMGSKFGAGNSWGAYEELTSVLAAIEKDGGDPDMFQTALWNALSPAIRAAMDEHKATERAAEQKEGRT